MDTINESAVDKLIREHAESRRGEGRIGILIGQNGWVFVGVIRRVQENYELTRAACVRRWGTEKGLGQIAFDGPTNNTILDHCPPLVVHAPSCMVMWCVPEKWQGVLRS